MVFVTTTVIMTLPKLKHLVQALKSPGSLETLGPASWDILIRQARHGDLLARIGAVAKAHGVWDSIPAQPRMHIESAWNLSQRQHVELRHEVSQIERALGTIGLPVVLLKGAAYTMSNLNACNGRLVSDVDILVPKERLAEVESALMMAGWVSTNRDTYDQRYYRTWMHELPPMRHMTRGTVLDVHHAIMPVSARLKPDTALLLARSLSVPGLSGVRVLSRPDMVLHSAAHLFHEGEFELGLRGIVDLDALMTEFSEMPDFWPDLVERASTLQLEWPLLLAMRYTRAILGTAIPEDAVHRLERSPRLGSSFKPFRVLDAIFLRALRPAHPSADDALTPIARFVLYVRGHWLRMPPWLLLRHLGRKLMPGGRHDVAA